MKKRVIPVLLSAVIILSSLSGISQTASGKKPAVLNHIALYVVDLKVSTAFYQDIIRLDTIPEPFHDGRHTWFSIGAVGHLHVISGAKAKEPHDKNSHLCFSVPSVEAFIPTLTKNNIPYENWAGQKSAVTNRVDGVKQIYFQDPDGYWVEINDDKY